MKQHRAISKLIVLLTFSLITATLRNKVRAVSSRQKGFNVLFGG